MIWITYRTHYGKMHSPVDHDPNTYSGIAIFTDELEALRYANATGTKAVLVGDGETLEQAIKR